MSRERDENSPISTSGTPLISNAGLRLPPPLSDLPAEAELAGQMVGENRVVMLRQGDDRGMHRTTIQGPPLPIMSTLQLVRNHHMSVQLRIGQPAVVMVIRRRNQTKDVDLRHRPSPGIRTNPGHCNIALHQIDDLRNSRVMGMHDQRLRAAVGHSPQRADALGYREGVVEPGNSTTPIACVLLAFNVGDRLCPLCNAELRRALPDADLDPLRRGLELRPCLPERFAGDRVAAQPEKKLQVRLGHFPAGLELSVAETMNPGPHPEAARRSLLLVIPRQRRCRIPVPVTSDHRLQQIPEAVTGGYHPHRHRHAATPRFLSFLHRVRYDSRTFPTEGQASTASGVRAP